MIGPVEKQELVKRVLEQNLSVVSFKPIDKFFASQLSDCKSDLLSDSHNPNPLTKLCAHFTLISDQQTLYK